MSCACQSGTMKPAGLWLVGPPSCLGLSFCHGGPRQGRPQRLSTCLFILRACLGAPRAEAGHLLGFVGSGISGVSIWFLSLSHPNPHVPLVPQLSDSGISLILIISLRRAPEASQLPWKVTARVGMTPCSSAPQPVGRACFYLPARKIH